jgi:hypothetical protein
MGHTPELPVDKNGAVKQNYVPARTALSRTNKENAALSSILLLGHDTTELEVAAVNQHVAAKWLTQAVVDSSVAGTSVLTAVGTGNWDHMIQTNTVRRFAIPIASNPQGGSVQGVNRALGLYPAIGFKTFAGNGSVMTAEY